MGQLTSGVAHDFSNLLMPIIGGLDMLQRHVTDERSQRLIQRALQLAERAKTLVQHLLDFAPLAASADVSVSVAEGPEWCFTGRRAPCRTSVPHRRALTIN
jgi:signal transduction histidine kinase